MKLKHILIECIFNRSAHWSRVRIGPKCILVPSAIMSLVHAHFGSECRTVTWFYLRTFRSKLHIGPKCTFVPNLSWSELQIHPKCSLGSKWGLLQIVLQMSSLCSLKVLFFQYILTITWLHLKTKYFQQVFLRIKLETTLVFRNYWTCNECSGLCYMWKRHRFGFVRKSFQISKW